GQSGFAFVIQPERRSIAWWQLQGSQLVKEVAGDVYRPLGRNSVRDLAGELVLIAAAASALAFLAWSIGGLLANSLGSRPGTGDRGPRTVFGPRSPVPGLSSLFRIPHSAFRPYYLPLTLFMAGTVLTAAVCVLVLDGIPHVQDDVAYIFQARIFAHGRSWVPTPPGPEFFANGFIEMFDGRWFTKY